MPAAKSARGLDTLGTLKGDFLIFFVTDAYVIASFCPLFFTSAVYFWEFPEGEKTVNQFGGTFFNNEAGFRLQPQARCSDLG